MMNANVLEGLKLIYKGIAEILESASQTENTVETKKPTTEKKSAKTKEVVEETTEDSTEISKETLESMSYNDLKKLAKDFGISAAGSRKELVEKLLSLADSEAEEEPEEEEEAPKKTKKSKKSSKKVEEPVEEDEDDEESDESDDEEDDEEDLAKQIEEALEDYSDDDLREILEDADIPSKGKRQALITKIINAVEDGILDLDLEESDEEEDSDDDEAEVEDEEETVEETEDDEEEESKEDEDVTANMTKKRKKAFESMCDETSESFESGELTREDLIDFINEYNGTKDKMKKVSDEDLLTQYFKLAALFIDDDGTEVEEGAYYINDEPYCCGHPLSYDKKKKQYVCESCGSKYDVED